MSSLAIAQRSTVFRVVCAWCQSVLVEGDKGAPTSHGLCDECDRKVRADLAA